jgi:TonB family protein
MHRRIHRLFADGFLADLENLPSNNPLNDRSLVTTLEIILDDTGRIHRLGVARTSGNMAFDVASLNAVRRAAPFGSVPQPILSGDGRVYMHWAFYRNERQCGTFNAEPYIMPNPGSPTPGHPAPGAPLHPRDDRGDATPIPSAASPRGQSPSRPAGPTLAAAR